MCVGERRKIEIPARLAYGRKGSKLFGIPPDDAAVRSTQRNADGREGYRETAVALDVKTVCTPCIAAVCVCVCLASVFAGHPLQWAFLAVDANYHAGVMTKDETCTFLVGCVKQDAPANGLRFPRYAYHLVPVYSIVNNHKKP